MTKLQPTPEIKASTSWDVVPDASGGFCVRGTIDGTVWWLGCFRDWMVADPDFAASFHTRRQAEAAIEENLRPDRLFS